MDPIALIEEARRVGLELTVNGTVLRIRGQRRHAQLAQLIASEKAGIIATLHSLKTAAFPSPLAAHPLPSPPSADTDTRGQNAHASARVSAQGSEIRTSLPTIICSTEPKVHSGDGDKPRPHEQSCGALHVQPQHWEQRDGRAFCPTCDKFMGNLRSGG
jgi:hypothetical protein